jgi:hypothetical protein
LIGIVKKNGVMLVDFALVGPRERGLGTEEAIHEAARLRFRPILMMTMCALLGGVSTAARHRHQLGDPSAARLCDRRRPDGVAAADIVHDAGRLHLHGPPGPSAEPAPPGRPH